MSCGLSFNLAGIILLDVPEEIFIAGVAVGDAFDCSHSVSFSKN